VGFWNRRSEEPEPEPTVPNLIAAMRELQELLRDADPSWAERLDVPIREVEASDAHGARLFLELHGGMGSLTDLCSTLGGRFEELDSRAWSLATALVREIERRG
jgi:Domain of unknown function (DUF6966)